MSETPPKRRYDPRLAGLTDYLEERRRQAASRVRSARGEGNKLALRVRRDQFRRWREGVEALMGQNKE